MFGIDAQIAELNEDLQDALDRGNQGEAEEIYRELEELCAAMA